MKASATAIGAPTAQPAVSPTRPLEPLAVALARLARGEPTDLAAVLHDVERHVVVEGTNITAHCHCLTLDGNGRPRIESLVEAVAEHVLDYAIPRSEYRAACEEAARTGSSQKVVRLHTKARELFTDLILSGEGGELLLFALAEKLLKLPQLICKMSLKTNTRMHIHGADGLHAGIDEVSGKLLLYWGESKIFGNVTSAIRDCLKSLAPMLQDHEASKRDLQLLQRHLDVDNEDLENALKKFLNPDDPGFNLLEFRGLCLVGFDCDAYPEGPSRSELEEVVSAITSSLPDWKKHVVKRVTEEKIEAFSMHFLFVPFPSADEFRKLFREHLGLSTEAKEGAPEMTCNHPSSVVAELAAAAAPPAARAGSVPKGSSVRSGAPTAKRSRSPKNKGAPRGAP
ncbi:conserved protein of unknown function [Cyanobium sp. NIES-981]|nr:conserved protein of unknown function [Cyanobium sp. NIES-981]